MPGKHFVIAVMLITYGGPVAYCFFMDETTTVGGIPGLCPSTSDCPLPTANNIQSAGTAAATLTCGDVYRGTTADSTGNLSDLSGGECRVTASGTLVKFEDFTTSYTTVTFDMSGSDGAAFPALTVMTDLGCDGTVECLGFTTSNTFEASSACSYWVLVSYLSTGNIEIEARCS